MVSEKKQVKKATKALHRLQGEHQVLAIKIETTRRKLDKRNHQMQTLESKMAKMERRAHRLGNKGGQPTAVNAKALRSACLIFNPDSRSFGKKGESKAESLERIVATLRAHGIHPEVYPKTSGKAAREWARAAVTRKEELIIVAGGDGTIGDIAMQLVGSQTVLGILPTGTMNNVARELGIPLDLDQACMLLGAGITRQIDVGRVRTSEESAAEYFLETAGLGLAVALPDGQAAKKGRWGKLPGALRKLFEVKPTPIEIELDNGEKIEANSQLVTVSNAPLYGLNNLIAPEAKMDDGLLDIAFYDGMSDIDLAAYFLKTSKGRRVSNPNVRLHRARRVLIRSRQVMPTTSDNDEIPDRQVLEIDLLPQALTMIVGKGSALVLPVDAVPSVPPLAGGQSQPKNGPTSAQPEPANKADQPSPDGSLPKEEGARI